MGLEEIARDQRLTLKVADPSFLLRVRHGEFGYEWLLAEAERKLAEVEALYLRSKLPAEPDVASINAALVSLRCEFWETTSQL